jgi:tRNA threonylcarbamoyladenosine biosynthesis protein TsaB
MSRSQGMRIVSLDTSTPSTAVGLLAGAAEAREAYDHPGEGGRPGHQARLLPLAEELLAGAGLAWGDIDRVVVGLGPGTYTGLRVGVATARALAQSLGLEIVGVSSSMALAHAAFRSGHAGPLLTLVDARRSELFVAAYAPSRSTSGLPEVLGEPRPVPVAELAEALGELETNAGIALGEDWLAVGNGVADARTALSEAGVQSRPEDSALHGVNAAALCELGARVPAQELDELTPDYRRLADAEVALADREDGRRVALAAGASG